MVGDVHEYVRVGPRCLFEWAEEICCSNLNGGAYRQAKPVPRIRELGIGRRGAMGLAE